ncbi:MAG: hypothetical protein KDA46_14240 [Parvularculaceae bacterium]|nr:hypothetical protein [Parvularculaceae bacterium]
MILRRITNALKRQDWITVLIETLIVVLGVFLGLQVNNWNAERTEHAQSLTFTHALENDLHADAALYRQIADYYSTVREDGLRALASLEGSAPLADEALVVNAYRASQVALAPVNRSTFDELVSTGRINLITDLTLRAAATEHFGFNFIDTAAADGRQSDYRRLFRGTIPPDAHHAARTECGDRSINNVVTLDYPCSLGLTAGAVSRAADALRADDSLPPALRRRINELDVQIADLESEAGQLDRTIGLKEER